MPVIASGLGVSLATAALVVTARSMLALLAPLLASLADIRGRRVAMVLALSLLSGGMALIAIWPSYWTLLVGLLLGAAGKYLVDPSSQAYLGDTVDYSRRGLVIGITEASWSAAFFLGMPLAGLLIARRGWSAPMPWLAALAGVAALLAWRFWPADVRRVGSAPDLGGILRAIAGRPVVLAALAVGFLFTLGNQVIAIVYGAWLESSFGLRAAALGVTAIVIGGAELSGEGLVATLCDRLGKRRAIMVGILANVAAGAALPFLGRSLYGGLVGLFLFFITFEFGLVSALTFFSELVPGARATWMSSSIAAMEMGHALGAILGPALFHLGLGANSVAAVVIDLAALGVLVALARKETGDLNG